MTDPLARYPDMLSIKTLARLLDVHYRTAWAIMQKLPHTSVGLGQKNESPRVGKEDVRARFFPHTIKPNLKIAR